MLVRFYDTYLAPATDLVSANQQRGAYHQQRGLDVLRRQRRGNGLVVCGAVELAFVVGSPR